MPHAHDPRGGDAGGVKPGRGGFMRDANDVAYVTDPSGALVKSGERKGQPKRLRYGSPSGIGKQVENTANLVKWGERRFALGIARRPDLLEECRVLLDLDVDSAEYKAQADKIVVAAKEAAEAALAADQGTHTHSLSEDSDEGRDWVERAAAGELLGIPTDAQARLVAAWTEMLERDGLEVLAVECSCVDDAWRLAGTLDRIARTTKSLRFTVYGGEIVEIPADTVLVLDVKSGRRRTHERTGAVQYWQGYAVQVAAYAQSVPYDVKAETRGEWPWQISQDHALIAHLDVAGAIAGEPSCELVYVDLAQGRAAGELCVAAKAWDSLNSSKSTTFSIAQISATAPSAADDAPGADPSSGGEISTAAPSAVDVPGAGVVHGSGDTFHERHMPRPEGAVVTTQADAEDELATARHEERRQRLLRQYKALNLEHKAAFKARAIPAEDLDAIEAALVELDPFSGLNTAPARAETAAVVEAAKRPEPVVVPPALPTLPNIDQGDAVPREHFTLFEERFAALDPAASSWIHHTITRAGRNGVPFSLRGGADGTQRSYHLIRGLLILAGGECDNDELLRQLVATVTDDDLANQPIFEPGHVLGALDATQAERFADLAAALAEGSIVTAYSGDADSARLVAA